MNATSTFRPSASSPSSVDGPSAMILAGLDLIALLHQRTLRDAGVLVERWNLSRL